mgnify:CR=1 FL=1
MRTAFVADTDFSSGLRPMSIEPGTRFRKSSALMRNREVLSKAGIPISDCDVSVCTGQTYENVLCDDIPHLLLSDKNFEHRAIVNAEVSAALFDHLGPEHTAFCTYLMHVAYGEKKLEVRHGGDALLSELTAKLALIFPGQILFLSGFFEVAPWEVDTAAPNWRATVRRGFLTSEKSVTSSIIPGLRRRTLKQPEGLLRKRIARDEKANREHQNGIRQMPSSPFFVNMYHTHFLIAVMDQTGRRLPFREVRKALHDLDSRPHSVRVDRLRDKGKDGQRISNPLGYARHCRVQARNCAEYAIKKHGPEISDPNLLRTLIFRGSMANHGIFNIALSDVGAKAFDRNAVSKALNVREELFQVAGMKAPAAGRVETAKQVRLRLYATARPLRINRKDRKVERVYINNFYNVRIAAFTVRSIEKLVYALVAQLSFVGIRSP